MSRLRLTTAAARARIKDRLNERLRSVQSSVGLAKTRRGMLSVNCVSGTVTMATTGVLKVFTVAIPLSNRVLTECTMDHIRYMDPSNTASGIPLLYAVEKVGAVVSTLHFYPNPDAIYAIQIDGLLVGSDMTADGDVPGIPEDFHDMLIAGAEADEYGDMEDAQAKVVECEARFDKRLRDLRYFLAKSKLGMRQGDGSSEPAWLANLGRWIF